MRITNRTRWRTEEIRAIAQRVAADELEPWEIKALHIVCVPNGYDKLATNAWRDVALILQATMRLSGNEHHSLRSKPALIRKVRLIREKE